MGHASVGPTDKDEVPSRLQEEDHNVPRVAALLHEFSTGVVSEDPLEDLYPGVHSCN